MKRTASEMTAEQRPKMRGGEGTVTIRNYFAKEEFGAKVRLCAEMTLPPGASIGTHAHEGEDEVYIVTQGSGLLDEGKGPVRVSAGDAILTGKGASHSIRNDDTEDLRIIAMIMLYA